MRLKLVDKSTNKSWVYNYDKTATIMDLKRTVVGAFETFESGSVEEIQFETLRPSKVLVVANDMLVSSMLPSGSICLVSKYITSKRVLSWTCCVCTLINDNSSTTCAACGSPKYKAGQSAPSNNNGAGSSGNDMSTLDFGGKISGAKVRAIRRIIPSDNSCLFNAIAYVLEGKRGGNRETTTATSIAAKLRNKVATKVLDSNKWSEAVLGMQPGKYVNYIQDKNRWGGGIECSIFAHYYQCEICAIDIETKQRYCFGEASNFNRRAFLLYTGTHYDAIGFCRSTSSKEEAAEDQDITILDLPLPQYINDDVERLVSQLRAAKQFTNLGNFNTQCCICYKKFKGRHEVVKHAESTGHQNYSEIPP